ncbi:MAG: hypothetical protein JSV43_04940 [Methanobacteriota archaeon]|nr:MAG: hypothetical protein JSV43_04940 [Euryarchaeota archaeon]
MQFHICGARGRIPNVDEVLKKLKEFCERERCEGQVFDAGLVFGKSHILSAYEHAKRAFDERRNSSKSLVNEVLLYSSGERQISSAIGKMGIKEGSTEFCVLLAGEKGLDDLVLHMGLERDDSVLDGDIERLGEFGISGEEKQTVPEEKVFDLVLERVAMVDLLK